MCVSAVIMKAFALQSLYVVTSQKMFIFASNLKHPNKSLGGIEICSSLLWFSRLTVLQRILQI